MNSFFNFFLIFLKTKLFKVFVFVFGVSIILKTINLKNYNIYSGRIVGLENVTTTKSDYKSNKVTINFIMPKVEYYKDKDTIRFDDGRMVLYSSFELNEKIRVLESKENNYKVLIFSFFYYWINYQELILILLITLMLYGIIKLFIFKEEVK